MPFTIAMLLLLVQIYLFNGLSKGVGIGALLSVALTPALTFCFVEFVFVFVSAIHLLLSTSYSTLCTVNSNGSFLVSVIHLLLSTSYSTLCSVNSN